MDLVTREQARQALAEMKQAAKERSTIRRWYEKAMEFLSGLESRITTICLEDFLIAKNYFWDVMVPKAS